jgi:hypothetical protein
MNVIYCKECDLTFGCDDIFLGHIDRDNWICEICNQPERSKREDLPKWAARAVMMPDGLCYFEDGTIIDSKQPIN